MADPDSNPDPDGGTGVGAGIRPHRGSAPGTPRWVKVFGIILVALVTVFVIVHIAGGGMGNH